MSFSELLRATQFDDLARAYEQSLVCPDDFAFCTGFDREEVRNEDCNEAGKAHPGGD